jgi:hypothetical protein
VVYLKSILIGLGAAVLSVVLLAAVTTIIATRGQPSGVGAVAINGTAVLAIFVIVFAVGFAWTFRRSPGKPSSR